MQREKIVVVGGTGFLGQELCRLGVALGHEIVSLSKGSGQGLSVDKNPWICGVRWIECDIENFTKHEILEGARSIVLCTPPLDLRKLEDAAKRYRINRIIIVELTNDFQAFISQDLHCRVYPLPIVEDQDWEFSKNISTVHVSNLGMALLRLSLEETIPNTLSGEELAIYGDVLMIQ